MIDNSKKSYKKRLLVVYGLAVLFGVACMIKIVHLSLFSSDFKDCVDATVEGTVVDPDCNCVIYENKISPIRGEIFDDKGRVLISNYSVFDIVLDGRILTNKNKKTKHDSLYCAKNRVIAFSDRRAIKQVIDELATAFYNQFSNRYNFSKEYYAEKLRDAIVKGKNVTILKSDRNNARQRVTTEDTSAIFKLPVFGYKRVKAASFPVYYRRINPYGELAKRTLGSINIQRNDQTGLEQKFNSILAGEAGSRRYMLMNNIRVPLDGKIEPTDGYNLQTTLNLDIQYIVYQCLMDKLLQNNAEWGCAVVMETRTGEIKAISNLTRTGTEGNYQYSEQLNYAFRHECEPGSTFKLASLLTYLEKTPDDSTKSYFLCGCDIKNHFSGNRFDKCYDSDDGGSLHRKGTPLEIFQRSYNEGTASMVFSCYPKNYKGYLNALEQFGIMDSLNTQLENIKPPTIRRKAKDVNTYYSTIFGAGFTMAPIQTLTYYNAIANNGKMVRPMFVKSITSSDGVVQVFDTEVIKEQICSPNTVERAKKYLQAVVTGPHGTARKYANYSPLFAGKTGTRDIWDPETKSYLKSRNSASFCGYFPAEQPQYTVIVYLYNIAKMSGEAVDVFANIAQRVMNIQNYATLKEYPKAETQNTKTNTNNKATPTINFQNVLSQIKGMNASQAIFELTKLGYSVKIEGKGVVKNVTTLGKNSVLLTLGAGG